MKVRVRPSESFSFKRANYVGYAGEIRGVCQWGTTKCEITLQDKSITLTGVTVKKFRRSDVWFSGINATELIMGDEEVMGS